MDFIDNNKSKVRVGIVGAGRMGTHHLRKFAVIAGVDVVGFYDPNPSASQRLKSVEGLKHFTSLDELLFEADAVVISSPTESHYLNGMKALQSGAHVLIEKPFCGSLALAKQLVELAELNKRVLQVGFVERHRFKRISSHLKSSEMSFLSFQRHSTQINREPSVGVIWDLMIHDIDLAIAIAKSPPKTIEASAQRIISDQYDVGRCKMTFDDGLVVDLFCSRVGLHDVRTLFGLTGSRTFQLNFLDNGEGASVDPLMDQSQYFIQAIKNNSAGEFSGKAALSVLSTLEEIHSRLVPNSTVRRNSLEFDEEFRL